MNQVKMNYGKLLGLCALLAVLLAHLPQPPVAAATTTSVDLNSEIRALDTFVADLGKFDKKRAELGRKESLTRAEFAALQNSSDDLKRRVSTVNNTLKEIVRKLKAAGQWDNLDATVLAKIDHTQLQALARRLSFKQLLDNAASSLASDADEISQPLESLRNRVKAQVQEVPGNSALTSRVVRVAYAPAFAASTTSFRCRVSLLRFGLSKAFGTSGNPSQGSINAGNCFCFGNADACQAL